MKKIIYLVAVLILIVHLQACGPTKSTLYIGNMHDSVFDNSTIFIDGEFFVNMEDGILLEHPDLLPGPHTIAFVSKDGKKIEFLLDVKPGENSLEYRKGEKEWLWNNTTRVEPIPYIENTKPK